MREPSGVVLKQFLSEEDEFKTDYGTQDIPVLKPPCNVKNLTKIVLNSSILLQTIQFLGDNVAGFGCRCEEIAQDGADELGMLSSKLDFVSPYMTLTEISKKIITDEETTGMEYLEVVRNQKGEFAYFNLTLPQNMRICAADKYETEYKFHTLQGDITARKRFRRFVMKVNEQNRYFKEWLDPRQVDSLTGLYKKEWDEKYTRDGVLVEKDKVFTPANEILYLHKYNPLFEPYGMPSWINQLDNITGEMDATKTRRLFFRMRGLPSVIVCVSGGEVPEKSIRKIEALLKELRDENAPESFYRIMVLHAKATPSADELIGDKPKPVTIDIKEVKQGTPGDDFFSKYVKETRDYQREAFRIANILLGGEEANQATAQIAKEVTEEFTLGAKRITLQGELNRFFCHEMKLVNSKIVILAPNITNYAGLTSALSNILGAVSANDLRELVGTILGRTLEPWDEDWANIPLVIMQNIAGLSNMNQQGKLDMPAVIKKMLEFKSETAKTE